jgi:hypothetical protein
LNNSFYKISRCEKISKNNLIYLKNKEETGKTKKGKIKEETDRSIEAPAFSPALSVPIATTGTNELYKSGLKAFFPPVFICNFCI